MIDTRDSNTNLNLTSLDAHNMQIYGPPAFDGSAFGTITQELSQSGDTAQVRRRAGHGAGPGQRPGHRLDRRTRRFQGGSIELYGGPWTITGNKVLGSMAQTYSPAAFSLHSPHDVTIEGNQVTQSDPAGREFRLVDLAVSGYDNVIESNKFGGGAGQIGDEVTYSSSTGQFYGINDPEVILAESTYGVLFEGRPGAISADGRLLVLPNCGHGRLPARPGPAWSSRSSKRSAPTAHLTRAWPESGFAWGSR